MTITEFLLARIAEDERDAREEAEVTGNDGYERWAREAYAPRVLAECQAKRRIVKRHLDNGMVPDAEFETGIAVQALASVYADHPDYDPAWQMAD